MITDIGLYLETKIPPFDCLINAFESVIYNESTLMKVAMNKKPYVLSVSAFILDKEGQVLLLQRAKSSKHYGLFWETPGGKADPGEYLDEALLREVKEETGLDVSIEGLVGMSDFELESIKEDEHNRTYVEHKHVCVIYFRALVLSGDFKLSDEHQDHAWIPWDAIHEWDITPALQKMIECLPESLRK